MEEWILTVERRLTARGDGPASPSVSGSRCARTSWPYRSLRDLLMKRLVTIVVPVVLLAAPALAAELSGTVLSNRLIRTSDVDQIRGLGGDDIITGRAGSDVLVGGAGADLIYPGAGDDRIRCGRGFDVVILSGHPEKDGNDTTRGCEAILA